MGEKMRKFRIITNGKKFKVQKRILFWWFNVQEVSNYCEPPYTIEFQDVVFNEYSDAINYMCSLHARGKQIKPKWRPVNQ